MRTIVCSVCGKDACPITHQGDNGKPVYYCDYCSNYHYPVPCTKDDDCPVCKEIMFVRQQGAH